MKFFCLLVALLTASLAMAESPWVSSRQADGVSLFSRPVPSSPYWEYRADTVVTGTADEVLGVILEGRSVRRWLAYTLDAEERPGEPGERVVRVVLDLPWPYADQPLDLRFAQPRKDSDGWSLAFVGLPVLGPESRVIEGVKGEWRLEAQNRGTAVRFWIHTELASSVPAWLANGALGDLPLQSLSRLRRVFAP